MFGTFGNATEVIPPTGQQFVKTNGQSIHGGTFNPPATGKG